jgi:peptidyl-tRNA hydrolase
MKSKLYILVRKKIKDSDEGHAALSIAHAMAAGYREWSAVPEFNEWLLNSFRKVLCVVSDEEFNEAMAQFPSDEFIVLTESAIPGENISLIFRQSKKFQD